MIEKITAKELHEHSIATLPSRPSLPSLYSGRSLSAKELREAFDKLPHLLAERFNGLIESLGLYKEGEALDSFSEALATGIREGHSLSDLFADIKNGALCEYMSADGEHTLAQVLASLSERLDDGIRYVVEEVGLGDIVSEVEGINGNLLIRKMHHSADFAKKEETQELKEELGALKEKSATKKAVEKTNARLSNVEELLYGEAVAYEEEEGYAPGSIVPENALPYASLDRLGGLCAFKGGDELLPDGFVSVRHTPTDTATYTGTLTVKTGAITFANGSFDTSATEIVLFDGTLPYGRYILHLLKLPGFLFRLQLGDVYPYEQDATEPFVFHILKPQEKVRAELVLTQPSFSGTVFPSLKCETLAKNPIRALRCTGKNLMPDGIYDLNRWQRRISFAGTNFLDYDITGFLPKTGKYTLSFATDPSLWNGEILYIFRSDDGGRRWIAPEGMNEAYIFTRTTHQNPFSFDCKAGEKWRLTIYPPNNRVMDLIENIQLELGETETEYEPYTETVIPIPEELQEVDGFGESLCSSAANHADFEKGVFVKAVEILDYTQRDEINPELVTDMFKTASARPEASVTPLPETERDLSLLPVHAGGAVYFDTDEGVPAYYKITYQTKITEEATL